MAWALATIAESLALGAVGIALMFIAISVAIQVTYPSFAHALEAVLLSFALAEQCRGRLRFALAFAAVSIFAKPSMGYIYSLLLVVIVVAEARQNRIRFGGFIRILTPAAVAFSAASILVGAAFGCRLLLRTVFPVSGAVAYHVQNFGFFTGSGSAFWRQPGRPWLIYLVDVSGFWIAGTIFLFCAAAWQAGRISLGLSALNRRNEMLLTCAIIHCAFLASFLEANGRGFTTPMFC